MAVKTYGYNLKDIMAAVNVSKNLTGPYGDYLQIWADREGKRVYYKLCYNNMGFENLDGKRYIQVGRFCRPLHAQMLADKLGKIKMSMQNSMWYA